MNREERERLKGGLRRNKMLYNGKIQVGQRWRLSLGPTNEVYTITDIRFDPGYGWRAFEGRVALGKLKDDLTGWVNASLWSPE